MYLCFLEGDDEISFDPDDIIENIEVIDDGWYMGDFGGRRGLFPSNYVEKIEVSAKRIHLFLAHTITLSNSVYQLVYYYVVVLFYYLS